MKATLDELIESYKITGSVWKTADNFGMCGQSVHERLVKTGLIKKNKYSPEELNKIREEYSNSGKNGAIDLKKLSIEMGRGKNGICKNAKIMGLTQKNRKKNPDQCEKIAVLRSEWYDKNPHPRGMLGKKHSKKVCEDMSKRVIKWHKDTPPEIKRKRYIKAVKTTIERYGTACQNSANVKVTWKQSWREIGGVSIYCRSRWEANYARYLHYLKESNRIKNWEHEPKTFWFEGLKRGCVSYLPDFKVTNLDDSHEWHEVKGWYDDRSKTKIKRFKKYFPKEKLVLIDSDWFAKNRVNLSFIIKDWEKDRR